MNKCFFNLINNYYINSRLIEIIKEQKKLETKKYIQFV